MTGIDFNNKTFSLTGNSSNGKADAETVFQYKQDGNLVTADYYGGGIKYGKIIAILKTDQLDMLYQCLTVQNQLRAGKAVAQISQTDNKKIKLKLNWEWIGGHEGKGISEYIEN